MANQEHLNHIKQNRDVWNVWRRLNPKVQPDLSEADLSGADLNGAILDETNLSRANLRRVILEEANLSQAYLGGADLSRAHLSGANLRGAILSRAHLSGANLNRADLYKADLYGANLNRANLSEANLRKADLSGTSLRGADLSGADLSEADLSEADLSGANLRRTNLVRTNLNNASLKDCKIYGISAWDVLLDGAKQLNLTITPENQPTITVDNHKIAQFIYLLLNNAEIRDVINTLTTKSVLILGRFTDKQKEILDALRVALRQHNYLPILFDFDPANTQTVRETVRTLAHLAYFIIADLTNASSIPEELETIVPTLAVPIQPLLEVTQKREFSMFKGYGVYPWVLPIYRYTDLKGLLDDIQEKVIEPATRKAQELAARKVWLNQEPF